VPTSIRKTTSVSSLFLFLLLLCCKRSEPTPVADTPAPLPAPEIPASDVCGAEGAWRFSCPSIKADESCNIKSIGAISQRFTITESVAQTGGSWTAGANKYTLDLTTCQVSGFTSGMPCRDLHFEADLRSKSGRNVYGCWDGAQKCQATWKSPAGHCSVTKE